MALQPGEQARAALSLRAAAPGPVDSLGTLLLVCRVGDGTRGDGAAGGGQDPCTVTLSFPLPPVRVVSSPFRCELLFPESATVRSPVQLGVRLTNGTPHFHAVEVALQPPQVLLSLAAAAAAAASGGSADAPAPAPASASAPLPLAFEPQDRLIRYLVELLPGASKAIAFNLVCPAPGFALFPAVVVKGTKTEGRTAPAAAAAAAVTAGAPGAAPGAPPNPSSAPSTPAAVTVATPKPAGILLPGGPDVMAILPLGPGGLPTPRGIVVVE
jgi:hypothetical protein